MEYCTCGKPLEFMEYDLRNGTLPSILVGCTSCKIKFFITATEVHDLDMMPHMKFDDWIMIKKEGKFSIKGKTISMHVINKLQPNRLL